jgi:prepilin-type N-terminal cleavage/methylation domain-containing protein
MKFSPATTNAFTLLELLCTISIGAILFTTTIHFSLLALRSKQSHWNNIQEQSIAERAARLLAEDIHRSPLRAKTLDNFPVNPPWVIPLWEHEVRYFYGSHKSADALCRKASNAENKLLPAGWKAEAENKNGQLIIQWISPHGNTYSTQFQ